MNIVRVLLDETTRAQRSFVNGDSGACQDLWEHDDDVTLAGPFGGAPPRGWVQIGLAMTRAATAFRGGTSDVELVHSIVSDDSLPTKQV